MSLRAAVTRAGVTNALRESTQQNAGPRLMLDPHDNLRCGFRLPPSDTDAACVALLFSRNGQRLSASVRGHAADLA
jgi:hypothetical protein